MKPIIRKQMLYVAKLKRQHGKDGKRQNGGTLVGRRRWPIYVGNESRLPSFNASLKCTKRSIHSDGALWVGYCEWGTVARDKCRNIRGRVPMTDNEPLSHFTRPYRLSQHVVLKDYSKRRCSTLLIAQVESHYLHLKIYIPVNINRNIPTYTYICY